MLWRRGRRLVLLVLFVLLPILKEAVLALVAACVDGVLRRGTRHRPEKTKDAGRGRAAARTIHARPAAMTSENATLKPSADGGRITRSTAMHNASSAKPTTRIDNDERTPAATASTASPRVCCGTWATCFLTLLSRESAGVQIRPPPMGGGGER